MTEAQQEKANKVREQFEKFNGHVYWNLNIQPHIFKNGEYDENYDLVDVEGLTIDLNTNEADRWNGKLSCRKRRNIRLNEKSYILESLKRMG